nr:retrovirus-related Pol polyprotein from transposon 17.6 [Tanacetum cinerariifolium]
MLAIFHDMIEESVEVFMEDFSVFGNSFESCLNNLDKMLQHCKDAHLVLNWEKCHFMVKEGIVLGHKVSSAGLKVDKENIDILSKLPPPANIKGIRSSLGHASFYRRFIKDFSKISRPLTKLLGKDTPFEFNNECQKVLRLLKEKLACAPLKIDPKKEISTKAGETFKKARDAEHEVLKREHSKKVKRLTELNKRRAEEYMWTMTNKIKPKPITDVRIHLNTKPIVAFVFRNNDKRNFDVHNPFKFTDFGITELDELGPIIQKKKNSVVKDLMISLSKRYEILKKIPKELGIQSALPASVLEQVSSQTS